MGDLGDGATYGEVQEKLEEAWRELNDEDKDNWSAQVTWEGKKGGAKKVSAYYEHLMKDWRKIKEELGEEASPGEVMKELGEVWKELHGGAKDKFAAAAAALAAEQEAAEEQAAEKAANVDPASTEPCVTAYSLFEKEKQAEIKKDLGRKFNGETPKSEIQKELPRRWKGLTDKDRYIAEAAKQNEKAGC